MGEAGVDCLLSCVAGVAVGVGVGLVAWSAGGVAAGLGALPAGATGSGCSEAGGVGIAIWMGTTSAISIFRMYSLRVQPVLSGVYLSAGWAGTAAHQQSAEIRYGKARIPLSFWQAADSSLVMTSPTFLLTKVFHSFASGYKCGLMVLGFLPRTFQAVLGSHSWFLIVSKSSSSRTSISSYILGLSLGRSSMLLMVVELAVLE
ncbi:hypothetical protein V6N13_101434 [Hibiscus sabdariffa]